MIAFIELKVALDGSEGLYNFSNKDVNEPTRKYEIK